MEKIPQVECQQWLKESWGRWGKAAEGSRRKERNGSGATPAIFNDLELLFYLMGIQA